MKKEWLLCPICNNKTRLKGRLDTVLENFPSFVRSVKRKHSFINSFENDCVCIIATIHQKACQGAPMRRIQRKRWNKAEIRKECSA